MIAEYRRILKNPTPERKKKCVFFDALHKIYQAKDANGVRQALNNYEEEYNLEPLEFGNMDEHNDTNHYNEMDHDNSDSGNEDKSEVNFSYALSPSHFNGVNMNGMSNDHGKRSRSGAHSSFELFHPIEFDQLNSNPKMECQTNHSSSPASTGSSDGQEESELNTVPQFKRMRSDANNSAHLGNLNSLNNLSSHLNNHTINFNNPQQFDIANNNFESSTLLIDRMFSHLTKETEVMREWVVLERERLSQEIQRKKEENEREERREKLFLSTLTKMQESMFNFLARSSAFGKDVSSMMSVTNGQMPNRGEHLNGLNDHNGDYDDCMG